MSSKGNTGEHYLPTLVHADMTTLKRGIFQQKTPILSIRGQISFGIQLQAFP